MIKVIVTVLLLVVLVGGVLLYTSNSDSTSSEDIASNEQDEVNEGNADSDVKVFVVDSSHLRFYMDGVENPDIIVNEGDKVRIEFTSSEGYHDWVVDEFNARTEKVNPGNKTSVEFIADKKGTFEYYCSVGKHRANGMFGNLIVN